MVQLKWDRGSDYVFHPSRETLVERDRGRGLAVGLIIILLGIWFLAVQFVPGLGAWASAWYSWPLIVVGIGVALLIIGLAARAGDAITPGCIIGGIGALLYWQNATNNWESWAYVWTLIPGFAGVGTLLAGLLNGKPDDVRAGWHLVLISAVMFAIFGSFFGALGWLGPYWPLLLIALGLVLLADAFLRSRQRA